MIENILSSSYQFAGGNVTGGKRGDVVKERKESKKLPKAQKTTDENIEEFAALGNIVVGLLLLRITCIGTRLVHWASPYVL